MFYRSVKPTSAIVLTLIVSFLAAPGPAIAQLQGQPADKQKQDTRDKKWQYKRNKKEYDAKDLDRIPSLDGLPAYSGSKPKMMHGVSLPQIKAGGVTNYAFLAREKHQDVANWYSQTLSSNGWNVLSSAGSSLVRGRKGSMTCSVTVSPSPEKSYQSRVQVLYQSGKAQSR